MKVGATCVSEFATRRFATRRRAALCVVWHWIHQRRRLSADKAHVRVKRRTDRRCDCVKAGPHKHAQNKSRRPGWRRRQLSCPAAAHQQGCWHSRDNAETSPTVQVKMRRSSRDVSDSIQRQSGGFQLNNREQTTENRCHRVQFQSVKHNEISDQRVQKKIEKPQLQFAQETMRSKITRMTPEKTFEERDTLNEAVVRIVNEAARAWSIECLQYEISRYIIPPASIKKAMGVAGGSRSPQTWGEFAEVKETSRAKSIWRDEDQQDWDSVEQQLSVQDPGAHAQPKQKLTRHHRSLRCHEQGIVQQSKGQIGWDQQACLRRYQQASRWEQVRFDIPEGAAQRWSEGLHANRRLSW